MGRYLERAEIVSNWSMEGVVAPREGFQHEQELRSRIQNVQGPLFYPISVGDRPEPAFRSEIAHILDSCDLLFYRPDLAFDAIWRACESELRISFPLRDEKRPSELKRMIELSRYLPAGLVGEAWRTAPGRVLEYVAKRLIPSDGESGFSSWGSNKVRNRMKNEASSDWSVFEIAFSSKYSERSGDNVRNAALLLRRVLIGEPAEIEGVSLSIHPEDSAKLLIAGFMYELRNDRVHSSGMPIHLSSRATIKVYSVPLFGIILANSLIGIMWMNRMRDSGLTEKHILELQEKNLTVMKNLMQGGWR